MDRRTFLALLSTPVALSILQSCGSSKQTVTTGSTTNSSTGDTTGGSTVSSAGGTVSSDPGAVDVAVTSINGFGATLRTHLAEGTEAPTNLVFSPTSIAIALSLVLAGAKGETADQLATTLQTNDAAALSSSMGALAAVLATRTQKVEVPGGDPVDVVLAIANSLWAEAGLDIETPFLDVADKDYGAAVQTVDYAKDAEVARKEINAWVSDHTKGRIPELLPQGSVDASTLLTIVNAVYMKAPWQTTFGDPSPATFTTLAGPTVQAPTMHVLERFTYLAATGCQLVELPYLGVDLSMIIALPDAGQPLSVAAAAIATGALDSGGSSKMVSVSLPSFDIQTSVELADALSALGIVDAFDAAKADLTGISTAQPPLYVGAVIHQANITVDKDGTEAAAATAVLIAGASAPAPEEPIDFDVNRPFAFAVRDGQTGAILFFGHIGDPTQTRH
ncbi:MAG: proteinase [Ilumatobacteraceae bacterium]|nr:proteinase [Ilumatobacteraceae bacterium]